MSEFRWISNQVEAGDLAPQAGADLALIRLNQIKGLGLAPETAETLTELYKSELDEIAATLRRKGLVSKQPKPFNE